MVGAKGLPGSRPSVIKRSVEINTHVSEIIEPRRMIVNFKLMWWTYPVQKKNEQRQVKSKLFFTYSETLYSLLFPMFLQLPILLLSARNLRN